MPRRVGIDALLFAAAFLAPWWLVIPATLGTLVYFGWYELIAVAVVADVLYGGTMVVGIETHFLMTTLALLAASLVPLSRRYLQIGRN